MLGKIASSVREALYNDPKRKTVRSQSLKNSTQPSIFNKPALETLVGARESWVRRPGEHSHQEPETLNPTPGIRKSLNPNEPPNPARPSDQEDPKRDLVAGQRAVQLILAKQGLRCGVSVSSALCLHCHPFSPLRALCLLSRTGSVVQPPQSFGEDWH